MKIEGTQKIDASRDRKAELATTAVKLQSDAEHLAQTCINDLGVPRAELMADATRLMSFVALRKLDDFLHGAKSKPDDLVAADFGIDVPGLLAGVCETFLTEEERQARDCMMICVSRSCAERLVLDL